MNRIVHLVLLLTAVMFLPGTGGLKAQGPPRRVPYVSACGRDIPWLEDFDAAMKRARTEKKPLFWFVPTADRTPMDRRQELYWYMMAGPFSDPAVVSFINEHFIPLKLGFRRLLRKSDEVKTGPRDLAKRYKLIQGQFIEPGFVVITPKGKLLHTSDRLLVFQRTWFLHRLRRALKMESPSPAPKTTAEKARQALGRGHIKEAQGILEKSSGSGAEAAESLWLTGVCQSMTRQSSKARNTWKLLVKDHPETTWAAKAQCELDGWGPFLHGFEVYRDFPDAVMNHSEMRHSRTPGKAADEPLMVSRGLRRLLDMQQEDGSWRDSRYDFGGLDSMPNVHMAVTAIAARGLLEWRDRDENGEIAAALKLAESYMHDSTQLNPRDKDEYVWAFVYRINYFSRLIELEPGRRSTVLPFVQELVQAVEKQQLKSGAWRHEYAAPFTTASVVQALCAAEKVGARVNSARIKEAARAVLSTRVKKTGAFGYGMRPRGSIEGSAGRMPLCELAIYLGKLSNRKKLETSVKISFERHEDFETARNYDDHMWSLHRIGGFFFWYDMHGRAEAINHLKGAKAQSWRRAMRRMIYSINEADGSWIDSHEVGKSYGTGMALTILRIMQDVKQ